MIMLGSITQLNTRVVTSIDAAINSAHPKAVYIVSTHAKINAINKRFLARVHEKEIIRIVADHRPANHGTPLPNVEQLDQLYAIRGDPKGTRYGVMLNYIDLYVGARVRYTRNTELSLGLFNGAMATVKGLLYIKEYPVSREERVPTNFSRLSDEQREIPIVLIQLDGDDSISSSSSTSCLPTCSRLIPVCAIAGPKIGAYVRYQVPLILAHARTAHAFQGMTAADGGVIDPQSMFYAGLYVGTSRPRCLEKLILLSPITQEMLVRDLPYHLLVIAEYMRLRAKFNILR